MRKIYLLCAFLFICFLEISAQRELSNPLIDSKKILEKGTALADAGKYKEAIAEYLKVSPSDTGYSAVLNVLIQSYYNDSNFVEAEKHSHIGLKLFPDKYDQWYSHLANVYDDTERFQLALDTYDTILARNKFNYLAYFNKGITLFRQEKLDEAATHFKQCIILNPYYASAHYFLGVVSLLKGNLVQAMLSFSTNLMVFPDNRYKAKSISYMATIAEVNTTATELLEKFKPGKEDNFEDIQDILVSKIAHDKKYKLRVSLEDQIVRQLQVMMEKLEYNANDKGFWMQYYVPLFKKLWDAGKFEPMVFYMFSKVDIKEVTEYNNKEKKKINEFSDLVVAYLNEIRETQQLVLSQREKSPVRFYISDYLVTGKGGYSKNQKNESVLTGPWEFYHSNGRLKSKGLFDETGQRKGEWFYYYEDGTLKESWNFTGNNKAHGKNRLWHDNGLLHASRNYINDNLEGADTIYFYNGRLLSIIHYKAGKKEGAAKYYNSGGYLRTANNYINDLQEGKEVVYHPNGKIESVLNYIKDLPEGEYKEYFDNEKIKISGNYMKGKKTGTWKTYYADGKPSIVENFENGERDGEYISYYRNGKIQLRSTYRKGEIDGKKEDFDDDGIIYSEGVFEKGRLKDIKFMNKTGAVISTTTSRRGGVEITFYGPDGLKHSQGYYSKDGSAEGKFITYFKNGNISSEGVYKNGLLEGKKTYYYTDKKPRQIAHYKNGKADGYFIDYYNNGQVASEGWYVDDEQQGTVLSYDARGNITSKVYYLNDKSHGIGEYYSASGKLDYKQFFDYGWLNKVEQYDTTGKLILTSPLIQGAGLVRFNLFNGKPYVLANYKHYVLNGVYTVSNGDGSKRRLCYYKNGVLDSVYTAWHPNGKLSSEGKYLSGDKIGTWKYYSYEGNLFETEVYEDGKLQGLNPQFSENGHKEKEYSFSDGELHGPTTYYGDNGQVMLVLDYKEDEILGYRYEDNTGKLVSMIPLAKGAGTVTGYYRNGTKSANIAFNESLMQGDYIFYSSNGKEQETGKRTNGFLNGIRKIYYPSGKIMKEEEYYFGYKHGRFKYYNEAGTVLADLNYYLDNLHGECTYAAIGKPAQTYIYYYGELQSKK